MLVLRNVINAVMDKVRNLDRCETLKRRDKRQNGRFALAITFNPKFKL
jgi:hypothetical protein